MGNIEIYNLIMIEWYKVLKNGEKDMEEFDEPKKISFMSVIKKQ